MRTNLPHCPIGRSETTAITCSLRNSLSIIGGPGMVSAPHGQIGDQVNSLEKRLVVANGWARPDLSGRRGCPIPLGDQLAELVAADGVGPSDMADSGM